MVLECARGAWPSLVAATLSLVPLGEASAVAEELLGVESDAPMDEMEPAPEASEVSEPTKRSSQADTVDLEAFTFSGGFSASKHSLGGQASVGYWFNRYLGIETTYFYSQLDAASDAGVAYGPEVAGILRAPNPTFVTPFVGSGLGYVKWQRSHDEVVFDAGAATTFNAFGGVNVGLTRHFGVQILRRQTHYLQDPPKSYENRDVREESTRLSTNIGFYMAF